MEPHTLRPLISAERIESRVAELAREISADHPDGLTLLVVLEGAATFAAALAEAISSPTQTHHIRASSYGESTASSGRVKIELDRALDLAGQDALIIEDIVDSGRTASALIRALEPKRPRTLQLAALLDKSARRVEPIRPDYRGFEIDDLFVVGYGLDYAQHYRDLTDIQVVRFEKLVAP